MDLIVRPQRRNQLFSGGLFDASPLYQESDRVDDRPTAGASGDERRAAYPLKKFYSPDRTMISGSLKGWWRTLSDQTLLWQSTGCNIPMADRKNPPG